MKKIGLKRMAGIAAISCLLPVAAKAQLIIIDPDGETFKHYTYSGGAIISLHDVPQHASDFFNYSAAEMFSPYNGEFIAGWHWNALRFEGSRKPLDVKISAETVGNTPGRWIRPKSIHATYDSNGRILTFNSSFNNTDIKYTYDEGGSLKDASPTYSTAADFDNGMRVEALLGHVQSTLNGFPSEVIGKSAYAFYHFDDNLRVIQVDFRFTHSLAFDGTDQRLAQYVTFNYTYDDRNNITEIHMTNLMQDPARDNSVVRMSYDSKNRLIEQVITGGYDSTVKYCYTYDDHGNVLTADKYEYDVKDDLSNPSVVYRSRYGLEYDDKGRVVTSQYQGMIKHYGSMSMYDRGWSGDTGVRATYTYDEYGNWTTLKLFMGKDDPTPYCTVTRTLNYTGASSSSDAAAQGSSPKATTITNIGITRQKQIASLQFKKYTTEQTTAIKTIHNLISNHQFDEAEQPLHQFMETDKTGYGYMLLYWWFFNKQDYDSCVDALKKAFTMFKESGYNFFVASNVFSGVAQQLYINPLNNQELDTDAKKELIGKACAMMEFLRKEDPDNLTQWLSVLETYYRQGIQIDPDRYQKKYEELEKWKFANTDKW